jgi:hypothetical protein
MKRQFRELEQETKEKISRSSKGKIKSDLHKQHISQAMRKYWETVPSKNNQDVKPLNDNGTM